MFFVEACVHQYIWVPSPGTLFYVTQCTNTFMSATIDVSNWAFPIKSEVCKSRFILNMGRNVKSVKRLGWCSLIVESEVYYSLWLFESHLGDPPAVFPLRFLSLSQFYQLWQNWRSSCTKSISFGWKLAKLSRKNIFFTHSHKICWANFSKCWANFATYRLRGNTVHWYDAA